MVQAAHATDRERSLAELQAGDTSERLCRRPLRGLRQSLCAALCGAIAFAACAQHTVASRGSGHSGAVEHAANNLVLDQDLGSGLHRHSHFCGASAASDLQREVEREAAEGSQAFQRARIAEQRRASAVRDAASGRALLQAASRPLTFHFDYQLDSSTTQAEASYLKETLMPAAAAVLSRSLQVRSCWQPNLCGCSCSFAMSCLRCFVLCTRFQLIGDALHAWARSNIGARLCRNRCCAGPSS